jgi:hypothetical protein
MCPVDSWLPETIEHIFLFCPHPQLVQLRVDFKQRLLSLSAEVSASAIPGCPAPPDFADDAALYATLQLCTGAGSLRGNPTNGSHAPSSSLLRPITRSVSAHAAVVSSMEWRRRHHHLSLPWSSMESASAWIAFLTWSWRSSISTGQQRSTSARFGERLVELICSHNQHVFSVRRKLLRDDVSYLSRDRDPPAFIEEADVLNRANPPSGA